MFNKQNLIDTVHAENGGSRSHSERIVDLMLNTLKDQVKAGKKVSMAGFGIFTMKSVKGRTTRNPRTGETAQVEPHFKVKFAPASAFKDFINQ